MTSRPDVTLAPLRRTDLDRVAAIHEHAFASSAITAFGRAAVRRYYVWLLEGPHDAKLIGAWHDGELVGFCAAGVFRGAMSGFLRANRVYLASRVLVNPSLLASELIRERIRQAVAITARFSRFRRRTTSDSHARPQFGVLSIATAPEARGLGAGRALMLEAEQRAAAEGFAHMVLTVHPENTRAISFYEQLGWKRKLVEGVWRGAMVKAVAE